MCTRNRVFPYFLSFFSVLPGVGRHKVSFEERQNNERDESSETEGRIRERWWHFWRGRSKNQKHEEKNEEMSESCGGFNPRTQGSRKKACSATKGASRQRCGETPKGVSTSKCEEGKKGNFQVVYTAGWFNYWDAVELWRHIIFVALAGTLWDSINLRDLIDIFIYEVLHSHIFSKGFGAGRTNMNMEHMKIKRSDSSTFGTSHHDAKVASILALCGGVFIHLLQECSDQKDPLRPVPAKLTAALTIRFLGFVGWICLLFQKPALVLNSQGVSPGIHRYVLASGMRFAPAVSWIKKQNDQPL